MLPRAPLLCLQSIEPQWYMPILPTVLVNGAHGIGTGYSTDIPTYNPLDIVANIRRMIAGDVMEPMHPWFKGFTGAVDMQVRLPPLVPRGLIHDCAQSPPPARRQTIAKLDLLFWVPPRRSFSPQSWKIILTCTAVNAWECR